MTHQQNYIRLRHHWFPKAWAPQIALFPIVYGEQRKFESHFMYIPCMNLSVSTYTSGLPQITIVLSYNLAVPYSCEKHVRIHTRKKYTQMNLPLFASANISAIPKCLWSAKLKSINFNLDKYDFKLCTRVPFYVTP